MSRLVLTFLTLAACGGEQFQTIDIGGDAPDRGDVDSVGPDIVHEPVTTSQPLAVEVGLQATVTDVDSGVLAVEVFFKEETSTEWGSGQAMQLVDPENGTYTGSIPADEVKGGGMHYFLHAVDLSNNESFMPEEGEDDPYHFRVDGG